MFGNLVADKVVAAIRLFAQCVRSELDRANIAPEVRQQLVVLFDNACVCYLRAKGNDNVTVAVMQRVRPRIRSWFLD